MGVKDAPRPSQRRLACHLINIVALGPHGIGRYLWLTIPALDQAGSAPDSGRAPGDDLRERSRDSRVTFAQRCAGGLRSAIRARPAGPDSVWWARLCRAGSPSAGRCTSGLASLPPREVSRINEIRMEAGAKRGPDDRDAPLATRSPVPVLSHAPRQGCHTAHCGIQPKGAKDQLYQVVILSHDCGPGLALRLGETPKMENRRIVSLGLPSNFQKGIGPKRREP